MKALRQSGYDRIIIGLTGNSMEEELADFSNAGADLVLTKPLKPRSLAIILKVLQENGAVSHVHNGQRLELDDETMVWVPRDGRVAMSAAVHNY